MFAFGLIDDLRSLPPPAKLAGQFAAAGVVIASGIRVEIVDNGLVGTALGLLWLVAITNAFNLLDNMDGLAGSLAVVGALFFAIDAVWIHSDDLLLVVSLALALAVAGFLPYNFRPRRPAAVFMGDSGSQVIGLTLAALGLATSWKVAESTVATLIIPLLVLAIPILDTALVTAVRLVEGRPIHQGGRDHTSHRLVRSGISEKGTVVLLTAIAAGLGLTSLAYSGLDNGWVTLVGVLVTFALLVQLAGFLTDIDEGETRGRRQAGTAEQDPPQPAATRGGRRRLRADLRLVHDRLPAVRGRVGHRLREAHLPRLAAGHPRRALPLLHPGRALQRRLALRRRA